jgi:hypothetical protein
MKKKIATINNAALSIFILLILFGSIIVQTRAYSAWNIQTVGQGYDNSIAVDSSGNPHIGYASGEDLNYASWTGSNWNIQTIDSGDDKCREICLVLDSAENPHISYYDSTNKLLKYAVWVGSEWQIQSLDLGSDYESSLALDSKGNPHISYYNESSGNLMYTSWNGSNWIIQTVDQNARAHSGISSIAVDSVGTPSISYSKDGNLWYAFWNGFEWNLQIVDVGRIYGHLSLALDSKGNPCISYFNLQFFNPYPLNGVLKYASREGAIWNIQNVDSTVGLDFCPSLALDSKDNPCISYSFANDDSKIYTVKYANLAGSVWGVQTVEQTENYGGDSFLALDLHDNPHISYGTGSLKYAFVRMASTPFPSIFTIAGIILAVIISTLVAGLVIVGRLQNKKKKEEKNLKSCKHHSKT